MSEPFIGQLILVPYNFAPQGWSFCNGQILSISTNTALFSLLGTTYGGNGQTTFALPDLRGRVPVGSGQSFSMGMQGGEEAHTLSEAEMPAHTHDLMADATPGNVGGTPSSATVLGQSSGAVVPNGPAFGANLYAAVAAAARMHAQTIGSTGGGQPHENRMPSLALNFCICIDLHAGEYPPPA
jgi:microcystin-dependent protein